MKVTSSIVLKVDLADQLAATWEAHNGMAQYIPGQGREVYSAGFRDALTALATAYGLSVDQLCITQRG